MKLEEIKKSMLEYTDLLGGKLLDVQEIKDATTKEDLAIIIDKHHDFINDMAKDTQSSLARYKTSLGL